MNSKLISSFALVTRFWKAVRASRSARGGVCGGFFPLRFLVWVMCRLNYRVLCINLQNPAELSKTFFFFLNSCYSKLGMGRRWRWNYKAPNSHFPPEASKLLGNALNIYLFKRLLDLKKKKTLKREMEKTWIKLSLIHNLSRKLIHAPTGS